MGSYLAGRATSGKHESSSPPPRASPGTLDEKAADTVLELLPTAAVLVDSDDRVRLANGAAVGMGIVKGPAVVVPEVAQLVRTARRTGITQTLDLSWDRGVFPLRVLPIGPTAQPLDDGYVALVVDDL